MVLAYIGPGPGYLLDLRGPGPYILGVVVLVGAWLVLRAVRGRDK